MADGDRAEMPNEHRFHVLYTVKPVPEGMAFGEIPEGAGACDALIVCSIVYPADGTFRLEVRSLDGRGPGPVEDKELFKMWSLLANRLSESTTIGENQRKIAGHVFEIIRTAILEASGRGDKEPGRS